MPTVSTLAASCAALSTAISQILFDTASFARRVRDARHDMNAINAELLAIKTSLDIARNDFSSNTASFPPPLLEAVSGILECCELLSGQVQKAIIKLEASRLQRDDWDASRKRDAEKLRRHLETLHIVFDLALDHVSMFTGPPLRSISPFAPIRNLSPNQDTNPSQELLKRIDAAIVQTSRPAEEDLLNLECWLSELRICAETTHNKLMESGRASKRSDSPLEVPAPPRYDIGDSAQSTSRLSGTVGAWIDNVASHVIKKSADRSERKGTSRARSRDEIQPSRSTFYAESSAAGSIYSGKVRTNARSRSAQPKPIVEGPPSHRRSTFALTITSNSTVSVRAYLEQYMDIDKIVIAKSKRVERDTTELMALDQDLRNIGYTTTHATVERMLFQGADPNTTDPEFGFLFIRAAFNLSSAIIRLLVEYGADITKTTSTTYSSVLHAAVIGRQLENVQYLIELGIPIDGPNSSGETALHLAAKTPGAYPTAKYLLEMGADVNAKAKGEMTPLGMTLVAEKLDSRERSMMMELLMAHGAEGGLDKESGKRRGKGLTVLGII
ncbi:ankyrin [Pleomassaria siparia CBS 279.74]|uniref:Ankyrin n=1 Tax=Pleomassaria siparia CBS 279.74 TaxID=1314801 RepID=A0A6G1K950_9PLEO|nr:ankyrin [Pleomassaria siparia CBS 279.74]